MDCAKTQNTLNNHAAGKALLWTMALCYRSGVAARKALYALNVFKTTSVHARVICFGNITTGGTGKTTAVMLAAKTLAEAGVRVAILTRGYKRSAGRKEVIILSEQHSYTWEQAGDEAYMMFEALREYKVPVIVCPDRVRAAQTAVDEFRSQVLLLDDGLQHFALHRDCNVILLDARDPFGGGGLLPLGRLREPKSALKRAGIILITHADLASPEQLAETKAQAALYNQRAAIIEAVHEPECFFDVCKSRQVPLDGITGEATALSAIGDPESFEETLRRLGLTLGQIWRYPDHHPYTIAELADASKLRAGRPLFTTYKDFTRFPQGWRDVVNEQLYVLSIHMRLRGGKTELKQWTHAIFPIGSQYLANRKQTNSDRD